MRQLIAPVACAALAAAEPPAPPARPWTNVSTLSFVATGGNSQGQTLGFANDYGYKWSLTTFTLKASAVRASSTLVTRTATGTSLDDAVVQEQRTPHTTAELFTAFARLAHRLKDKDRWYGFLGAGWERNRPAGLDARTSVLAGVGRIWADSEATKFRTDLGFGWTHERPLTPTPGFKANYGTGNLTAQFKQKLGATSFYTWDLAAVDNLSNGKDWQGSLKQGLTVTLSARFALKVGYDLFYRNLPNLIDVAVVNPLAVPPVEIGKIAVPAKKVDTVFTTSLVVTF